MQDLHAIVDEVRGKTDLVDLVARGGAKLEPKGQGQLCCSPLRVDKSPSFWVFPDHWYDFGTAEGGDAFAFVMRRDGVDFMTALRVLAADAGVAVPWGSSDPLTTEALSYTERRAVQELQTEAVDFYHHALPQRIRAEYFHQVYGLLDETIDELRLGWAPGGSPLAEYFTTRKGYSKEACLKTGFFLDRGGELVDFFQHRLVLPYWSRGLVVYAIARRTEYSGDESYEKAKYKKLLTHSEKHPFVSPTVGNDWFWGEDSAGRKADELLITEGITDAIAARQAGLAVISPVTVCFRDKDLPKLLRLTERAGKIIICNDSDVLADGRRPGEEGALKTAAALFTAGRDVRIATLPRAESSTKTDVCEYLRDKGLVALRPILDVAPRYIDFLIGQIPENGLEPAELDARLAPVAAAVATVSEIQRESYTQRIVRRWKLPKATVRQMIAHAKPEQTPAPQVNPARASDTRRRRLVDEDQLVGAVSEDIGAYYRRSPSGANERISTFSLVLRRRFYVDREEHLVCDALLSNGKTIEGVSFPRAAFGSRRELNRVLPCAEMVFTGDDNNLQNVVNRLVVTAPDAPTLQGTRVAGYHETAAGPRWVWPGGVLGPEGMIAAPDVELQAQGSLPDRLAYTMPEDPRELARAALPELARLNEASVILPILGWFFATPFKPRLAALLGHFPILLVWGTAGSGKTTLVRLLWRLFGAVENEPFGATETPFAMLKLLSSTNAIPVVIDEYKPSDMGKGKAEALLRLFRRGYGGETEERGRANLTTISFKLAAPIAFAGESTPEDPAMLERLISVSPNKNTVRDGTPAAAALAALARLPIQKLALPYIQWTLGREAEGELEAAREDVDRILEASTVGAAPRVRHNLEAVVFGLRQLQAWAGELGVELGELDVTAAVLAVVGAVAGEAGAVKDAFDRFLEAFSVMAQLGKLEEERHYVCVDGKLCLRLALVYEVYLTERRATGREDETAGLPALRRIAAEKHKAGGYVLEASTLKPIDGDRRRCLVIDQDKIPGHLEYDRPPVKTEKKWGGPREGTGAPTRWAARHEVTKPD